MFTGFMGNPLFMMTLSLVFFTVSTQETNPHKGHIPLCSYSNWQQLQAR